MADQPHDDSIGSPHHPPPQKPANESHPDPPMQDPTDTTNPSAPPHNQNNHTTTEQTQPVPQLRKFQLYYFCNFILPSLVTWLRALAIVASCKMVLDVFGRLIGRDGSWMWLMGKYSILWELMVVLKERMKGDVMMMAGQDRVVG